ncbi:single-stranded DNA-binding protein [Pedobacter sp. WC2423]|uniref:single-stranded DNA-binding protein n=1 Tax=Pedobacter sp. WC2423 TaxID=3234142 RepID=UPI003464F27F
MEIIGRLTADANINPVKGNKEVVNFSIAINDSYRANGETKKVTTYYECGYWINTKIAQYLKKGVLVQLIGRTTSRAYLDRNGELKSSLHFFTNGIKLLSKGTTGATAGNSASQTRSASTDITDDLPF